MALPNNKYPGVCYLCGLHVAAQEGRFERYKGQWRVKHVGPESRHGTTCRQAIEDDRKSSSPAGSRSLVIE